MRYALPILLCSLLAAAADAQNMAKATLYTRVVDQHVQAAIQVKIAPEWHLFHKDVPKDVGVPTTIKLTGTGVTWGEPWFPPPIDLMIPGAGPNGGPGFAPGYEDMVVFYAQGDLAPGAKGDDVKATLVGQTCNAMTCTPYDEVIGSSGPGPDAVWKDLPADLGSAAKPPDAKPLEQSQAKPGDRPAAATRSQPSGDGKTGLAAFLLLAVGWGLFSLLMPCTYPMIPITISFFTKQASARGGKVLDLSLLYGLGIVAIFILIGVAFGSVIIPFASHPITNLVIGALFILFAFSLFGAIDLQPPQFLMRAASKASTTGGYLGVFLMGATLVITSFTCTAPFVGSLLSVGAQDRDLGRIVMGMGTFGLTMAVPFVALALVPGRIQALPKSGEWMHTLKVYLGFVEVAAALKFLSNVDVQWKWGFLSRELFLVLWFGIFLVAALYLFGVIRLDGDRPEVSPKRLSAALVTLLFGLYCGYGAMGNDMDQIMTAIIPPYSNRIAGAGGGSEVGKADARTIIIDDYGRALDEAKRQHKLLLVNFTGHT